MPDITPAVRPPNPIVEIIRKAVNAAHAAGLTVSTVPDLGVHCTSTHAPRWEVEQRVQVISPLGAVLLALQPAIVDADAALAHALGVNRIYILGFDEGQSGLKSNLLIDEGPAARLYGQGFAAGVEFRAIMHRRAGVPVERAPDEPTPVVGPPRDLLVEAMKHLTVSEVLETLAETVPGRAGTEMSVDDAAEWTEIIRELAEQAKMDEV